MSYKVTSRKDLYEESGSDSDSEVYLPKMEFDIVEVEDVPQEQENADEFAFPLFGSSGSTNVVTVSLKPEDEDVVVNERPESYYRAIYSEIDHQHFKQAAISVEDIFLDLKLPVIDIWPRKVVNLEEYNAKVLHDKLRSKRKRPGMKKRANAIKCRERRLAREKETRKLQKQAQAKMKQKMYKKPRKVLKQAPAKPKYRTE